MNRSWFFIINPVSGQGKSLKLWKKVKASLDINEVDYTFQISNYSSHTISIVKEKIAEGEKNFIGIGGDGTINEMVNGVFNSLNRQDVCLGLLSVGTGNDWVRSLPFRLTPENLVQKITDYSTISHKVGKVSTLEREHYFINVAGAGIDGVIAQNISGVPQNSRLSYLVSLVNSLISFQTPQVIISQEGKEIYSGKLFTITSSIGKYFGGGMMISPDARIESGNLNFTLVRKHPVLRVFPHLPKLFTGKLKGVSFIDMFAGPLLSIKFNEPNPIQADGELVGTFKEFEFHLNSEDVRVLT